jgi:hypothetical protein
MPITAKREWQRRKSVLQRAAVLPYDPTGPARDLRALHVALIASDTSNDSNGGSDRAHCSTLMSKLGVETLRQVLRVSDDAAKD